MGKHRKTLGKHRKTQLDMGKQGEVQRNSRGTLENMEKHWKHWMTKFYFGKMRENTENFGKHWVNTGKCRKIWENKGKF